MRIRKRNAPVVEPAQHARSPVSAVKGGNEDDYFRGKEDNCTCCARLRRLENREGRNEFERECHESGNGFANGISRADDNQVLRCEEKIFGDLQGILLPKIFTTQRSLMQKESDVATTMELLGGLERVENEGHIIEANGGTWEEGDGHSPSAEGDVNHPGNKPKESLLYSLYCVFSKLSGKAVLTAREALSRIIEERLPGLDEETGLPSVQVAKVMRSNPYFVHIEGGKFFMCSSPSSSDSKGDPDWLEDFVDNEQPARSTGPSFQSKKCPRNSFSKGESSKERQQQQQPSGSTEVMRTKRPRSKEVATIDVEVSVRKGKCTSSGSKREVQQRALKNENSVSEQGKHGVDPAVPICKRYDGRGWKCHEIALPGYSMCRHHHELIVNRLARLRSSGRLRTKKAGKRRKASAKLSKEDPAVINEGERSANIEQNEANWWKNVKARSLKSINN